jgi:hypothetical protein
MLICESGFLNDFVKPVSEGGWGLCEWIVSQMSETRTYAHTEIYTLIQGSALDASIKALTSEQIQDICVYMVDKIFSGVTIGRGEHQKITYEPSA